VNKETSNGLTDMAMLHTENLEQLDTISTSCQVLSHAKWEILERTCSGPSEADNR
jgi:hypothetical protein